ncbi:MULTISPECIES: hypothetical protein [unclassified Neisseria]|uniref:hypothetical protein n=1 Tax=unclassified Neisseria TaxID=2623750 RepID=UPI001071E296|nr:MULTISPECIES: hypothetical protein [unclassified Neisseria]MBF0803362.1 hypothetical protein [Neisseria sp. 19428wB4_WF04]TFU44024.1 hypothetical protein E4T99_03170 [Neisseria sp. WF04]
MANDYWQLKRKDTGAIVRLPQDMRWLDEFEWSKVAQAAPQRTLSGGLVIQQGIKLNGRPVTLGGDWAWLKRGDLHTLREWSDTPALEMELTHYDGRTFDVAFRLHDATMNRIEPVRYATPETDGDKYTAAILLMTI